MEQSLWGEVGEGGLQGYLNLQNLVALEPKNPHDKLKMQS